MFARAMLAVFALSVAAFALPAQARPAAETLPAAMSPRSSFLLSFLEQLVRERDRVRAAGRTPRLRDRVWLLPGWRCEFVHAPSADGPVERIPSAAGAWQLDPERWGVYVFAGLPSGPPDAAFFVAADGPVLWCANREHRYQGGDEPAPWAALGRGGDRKWAARQGSAGVGEDGELWQTTAAPGRSTCAVVVVDENGAPMPGAEVDALPVEDRPGLPPLPMPYVIVESPLPAAIAVTDARGRGTLCGGSVCGLQLYVSLGGSSVCVLPDRVRATPDGLHIALGKQDPAQLAMNERYAVLVLHSIASAEQLSADAGVLDVDGNGRGEYLFFAELTGVAPLRNNADGGVGSARMSPPGLTGSGFRWIDHARVMLGGYLFQLFLRDRSGNWVAEQADGDGARGVAVDPQRAEQSWCCLAWPVRHGMTGGRAFFVDVRGEVLELANADGAFSGDRAPRPWTTEQAPTGWTAVR